MKTILTTIYKNLLKAYGPQGWWPINNKYHPKDYSYPKTNSQKFEICIGAILTQNTSWKQVEKAIINLYKLKTLNAERMRILDINTLKEAIKPAGYFNQKAKKIKKFTGFYLELKGKTPTRRQLLKVWGIGSETADSILLYAYNIPSFVIDAYTKRIFTNLGLIKEEANYDQIKEFFENNLQSSIILYQEYHALIVEHAKRHYSRKPYDDPLTKQIENLINI